MSKKLFALLVGILFLGLSVSSSFAGIQLGMGGNRGDENRILVGVHNNGTTDITSGSVVIWDTTATDPTNDELGASVITTTSDDEITVAGIVVSDTILSEGKGVICVYGAVNARFAGSTDAGTRTAGSALGTTAVAGMVGTGTNVGFILRDTADGTDGSLILIFVNPTNGD